MVPKMATLKMLEVATFKIPKMATFKIPKMATLKMLEVATSQIWKLNEGSIPQRVAHLQAPWLNLCLNL